MGRPVALDDVQGMTIGDIKALEGDDEGAAEAEEAGVEVEELGSAVLVAPVIEPAKILDITRDLPTSAAGKPVTLIKANYDVSPLQAKQQQVSRQSSMASLAPATPDQELSEGVRTCCSWPALDMCDKCKGPILFKHACC